MRLVPLLVMLALALPAAAQDKQAAKKGSAGRSPAHSKPTAQQIRRFNELEKKEEKQSGKLGDQRTGTSR